jgi:protein tyrosine phosphatase (PTP) superfamily phosphohydrolase (DUF442 family)
MMRTISLLALVLLCACSRQETAAPVALSNPSLDQLLDLGGGFYSGAMPDGPEAFAALAALGIKTVVNVDSARPAVELARAAGLEYVHIPFGYDGVPVEAALALERVATESARPIYFHCHHGKHRGPTAAAIALRAGIGCSAEDALRVLEAAGTSEDYRGLWRDVRGWAPATADMVLPQLQAIAEVEDFAAGMAEIDRTWDRIKLIRKAAWQTPADHPDLTLAQEGLILAQQLHRADLSLPAELLEDREFEHLLEVAADYADDLYRNASSATPEELERRYRDLAGSCKSCHRDYRND